MPTATYRATQPIASTAIGPVAPKVLRLEWDMNDEHPETVTQVWQSPTLVDWTLFGEFGEPTCTVTADQPQMYFKIRNRLGNQFSDWATK